MGDMNHADSLVLFICAEWQSKKWYRYIFWFLFNVFFCNAFVLESECVGLKGKTLDFKLDLTHQHQRSMVSRNESKSVDGTKFQTEPCYTPKSICFSLYGGQKKEMHTVHKQGEEHPRATKWKQIWHICYIFKNFPWFLVNAGIVVFMHLQCKPPHPPGPGHGRVFDKRLLLKLQNAPHFKVRFFL